MRQRLSLAGLAVLAAGLVLALVLSPGIGLAVIAAAGVLLAASHPLVAGRARSREVRRAASTNGRPYRAAPGDLDLPARGPDRSSS